MFLRKPFHQRLPTVQVTRKCRVILFYIYIYLSGWPWDSVALTLWRTKDWWILIPSGCRGARHHRRIRTGKYYIGSPMLSTRRAVSHSRSYSPNNIYNIYRTSQYYRHVTLRRETEPVGTVFRSDEHHNDIILYRYFFYTVFQYYLFSVLCSSFFVNI